MQFIKRGEFLYHNKGGIQGPVRVVFIIQRRPEDRHNTVPYKFVQDTVVIDNGLYHFVKEHIQEINNLVRGKGLGNGGEIPDITEEHRSPDLLAPQINVFAAENFITDFW